MSLRKLLRASFIFALVLFIALPLLAFSLSDLLPSALVKLIYLISFIVLAIILTIALIIIKRANGLSNLAQIIKFNDSLDTSLISLGIYKKISDDLIDLPKRKIDLNDNKLVIYIDDLNSFNKLLNHEDLLEALLPIGYELDRSYFNAVDNKIVIYFSKANDYRYTFKTYKEFKDKVLSLPYETLLLDKKHSIDLRKDPMTLITGTTGSGKTFYSQTIIYEGLLKGYDIEVLDYKRTYQAFEDLIKCHYTFNDIYEALKEIIKELEYRQERMEVYLKRDPNSLAIDKGFKLKLIIIEEYLALVNSGEDKKLLKEIEAMILKITTLGRQLGIHILLVMQVSGADNLNSSIRANLTNKLVFGNANSTIYITAFGSSNTPKVLDELGKGEGYASFGLAPFRFKAPSFEFDIAQRINEDFRKDDEGISK